jgi:NAD(P)-dependent dehydrogenase (short-subunit alcohol dehydrogenase family)
MAKILLIGASGTIGKAVGSLLSQTHEVIEVGNKAGDYTVELSSKASIQNLLESVGNFDALVSTAGVSRFGKYDEASDEDYALSIENKLMGQVNLVRAGQRYVATNGSITLTSGLLGQAPWPATAPTAMVNAALAGFVRAAALDAAKGLRINVVSPVLVTETAKRMGLPTEGALSAAQTAWAYKACVEGEMNGQLLDVRDYVSD